VGDGHAIEPLRPVDIQVPLDFDLEYLGAVILLFISHKFLPNKRFFRE
jgi:hypothetical protein